MAEGFLRKFGGDKLIVQSAGIEAAGLNPKAVQVMQEIGLDISGYQSKTVGTLEEGSFDFVITVCNKAEEHCPYFPGDVIRLHQDFQDPAKATGTEEEILEVFRTIRDQVGEYCQDFVTQRLASDK